MNYCKINGKNYDVVVTSIEESYSILYTENTGRTLGSGARMTLDPLGTFFTHKVTFRRSKDNYAEFDRLYDFFAIPRYDGFPIEIVHGQTTIKYDAYVSQGARVLNRISPDQTKVLWNELSVNFIPMEAQVVPV